MTVDSAGRLTNWVRSSVPFDSPGLLHCHSSASLPMLLQLTRQCKSLLRSERACQASHSAKLRA